MAGVACQIFACVCVTVTRTFEISNQLFKHSGVSIVKFFILNSKAPGFMKHLMPKGSFEFHEESWNAYPYSKTVITVGDGVYITYASFFLINLYYWFP